MRLLTFGVAVLLVAGAASAQPLRPSDFAYGMELTLQEGSPLYELTLPPEAYRAFTRADFGDVRVFNGADEVVPHMLRMAAPASTVRMARELPFFPVYVSGREAIDGAVTDIRRDPQGRITRIESRAARTQDRKLAAYVLDASAVTEPLESIELEWERPTADFLGHVTLQASDDLAQWSQVASASLADMHFGADRLERRRIEFASRRAKYYRLSWPVGQPLPTLTRLRAEQSAQVAAPARYWEKATLRPSAKSGEYEFTLTGTFPVDRMRVQLLPQTNRVVQAQLLTRDRAEQPWMSRAAGSVYRLTFAAQTLESPDLALSGATNRQWLLRLSPVEGLENVEPVVEFGWVPHRLVFVASGRGPFRLAYGAAKVGPLGSTLRGVMDQIDKPTAAPAQIATAVPGPQTVLGGQSRVEIEAVIAWKAWVLWAVLGLAVGLLAWMARGLWRSMSAADGQNRDK